MKARWSSARDDTINYAMTRHHRAAEWLWFKIILTWFLGVLLGMLFSHAIWVYHVKSLDPCIELPINMTPPKGQGALL